MGPSRKPYVQISSPGLADPLPPPPKYVRAQQRADANFRDRGGERGRTELFFREVFRILFMRVPASEVVRRWALWFVFGAWSP